MTLPDNSEPRTPPTPGQTPDEGFSRGDYIAAAAAACLAMVMYLRTLAPTVTGEDSGELIAAAYTLGIPHPTGYPVWCLLTKLFMTCIPWGNIAWRANLMSAVFAAVTVFLTALIIRRLARRRVAALAGALALAFSREFWEQAVIAEVYALNAFFFALCILLLLVWNDTRKDRLLLFFALTYGLSLCNHSAMLMVGPVFALFILWRHPPHPRLWKLYISMLALAAAGWSVHLYLPIRSLANPPMDWGNPETLENFWDVITRKQYSFIFTEHPRSTERFIRQLWVFANIYGHEFTPWIAWLAPVGVAILWRTHRHACALIFGLFLVTAIGSIILPNFAFDRASLWINSTYWVNAYVAAAVFIGVAIARLPRTLPGRVLEAAIAIACVVSPLTAHFHHNDRSDSYFAYDYAKNIMATMDKDAIYFGISDHSIFPALYLQIVEGVRPDVFVANKYGYFEHDLYADMPPEVTRTFAKLPTYEEERLIISWLMRNSDRPLYFTRRPSIKGISPSAFANTGLLTRYIRDNERLPDRDYWAEYTWHTLDPADTRGDWSGDMILFDYHFARGLHFLDTDDKGKGLASFAAAITAMGEETDWLNDIATACAAYGLHGSAVEYYKRALARDPANELAAKNLARVYLQIGRFEDALTLLEGILQDAPDDYAALRLAARCLTKTGRTDEADALLRRAAALRPGDQTIHNETSQPVPTTGTNPQQP